MPVRRTSRRTKTTLKDEQREATRHRLLAVAKRLFEEHGYHAVSVTEIAQGAGVTHATIHAHFHAKAGLLYELIRQSNEAQVAAADALVAAGGTVLERLGRIVRMWAEHDLKDPELLAVMRAYTWQWPPETEEQNRAQLCRALEAVRRILRDGALGGELRGDIDVERLTEIVYAVYTLGLRLAIFEDRSPDECADEILRRIAAVLDGARQAPAPLPA